MVRHERDASGESSSVENARCRSQFGTRRRGGFQRALAPQQEGSGSDAGDGPARTAPGRGVHKLQIAGDSVAVKETETGNDSLTFQMNQPRHTYWRKYTHLVLS